MTPALWIVIAIVVAAIVLIVIGATLLRRGRLRALPDESRARYAESWRRVEARFLDHPHEAVREADALVLSILTEQGLDTGDPRRLPREVRQARALTAESDGDTERLRRAMVNYQRIVDSAVGERTRQAAESGRTEVA